MTINQAVHRFRFFNHKNQLEGMFTNLSCAQDTIRYRPENIYVSGKWYVVDYVTDKRYDRGQLA